MRRIVLFLLFLSSGLHAATGSIPASQSTTNFTWTAGAFSGSLEYVVDAVCKAAAYNQYPTGTNPRGIVADASTGLYYCQSTAWDGSSANWWVYRNADKGPGVYECPSGYTLNGTMCDPVDKCASTKDKAISGWVVKPAGGYSGTVCIDGCQYDQVYSLDLSNPQDERIGQDGRIWGQVSQYGKGTSCADGAKDQGQPEQKNKDAKKPDCGASEGVMTTSTGKVLCVPEGTPDARKPVVKKTESKATDGNGVETLTNKTSTTDPLTGATHTNTTVTSGGVTNTTATTSGGNGTGGISSGDNSGNEPGQCAKEPDSPLCKKGTVKDKGKFEEGQDAKLEEAKNQLTAKFNEVKAALSTALSSSASAGSGSLPCPPPVQVLGRSISLCVNDYADKLSVIGSIIVFAASILAILLVVTA